MVAGEMLSTDYAVLARGRTAATLCVAPPVATAPRQRGPTVRCHVANAGLYCYEAPYEVTKLSKGLRNQRLQVRVLPGAFSFSTLTPLKLSVQQQVFQCCHRLAETVAIEMVGFAGSTPAALDEEASST